MIENRELTMDDYLAMLRRRAKLILIPALLAPLAGFAVSYFFTAKYTSQAAVRVEGQQVPEGMVQSVVTEDLLERIAALEQQVKSQSRLQPLVERLQLARGGQSADEVIEEIRLNMSIVPMSNDAAPGAPRRKPGQTGNEVPGFSVNYTASNPRLAQQLCNELTSLVLRENLQSRQDTAKGQTDFFVKQVDDAKKSLDDQDSKLADFKKRYVGQLPGDEENNLKILMGLNSQLEANTQTLNRAQQDKSYTDSLLAQQLAAWNALQSSTNPQTLEKQLELLQAQIVDLQARYTADHPDVIKTKADIAEVKKKLAEMRNAPVTGGDAGDRGSAAEPAEIRQLRLQLHQYGDVIAAASRDQKRLQQEIGTYQGRISLSPAIEQENNQLTRDYGNAQKVYADLLSDKSKSQISQQMEQQAKGEQMRLLNTASLPTDPSFPSRQNFAAGGLGAGLMVGLVLALWLEMRDKSIRNEADAEAALNLPLLVSLPWVGGRGGADAGGGGTFWGWRAGPRADPPVGG